MTDILIRPSCQHGKSLKVEDCLVFLRNLEAKYKNINNAVCMAENCDGSINQGLWMCLSCGFIGCSRYYKKHAQVHSEQLNHDVVFDLVTTAAHCYKCDTEVDVQDGAIGKLRCEVLKLDKAIMNGTNKTAATTITPATNANIDIGIEMPITPTNSTSTNKKRPRPKRGYSYQKPVAEIKDLEGRLGLSNLGNTCFMNSVLQVLSNTTDLRASLLNDPNVTEKDYAKATGKLSVSPRYLRNVNKNSSDNISLYSETVMLMRALWYPSGFTTLLEPTSFYAAVTRSMPYFCGYHQQDAHEFLRCLCDRLHWEITSKNNKDDDEKDTPSESNLFIKDVFGCSILSKVTCLKCNKVSHKIDPCLDLSLDIPPAENTVYINVNNKVYEDVDDDTPTITDGVVCNENKRQKLVYNTRCCRLRDCFYSFTKSEKLKDAEKYQCVNCSKLGLQPATKSLQIWTVPKILCLHLKRFRWTKTTRDKEQRYVQFPLKNLNLQDFIADHDKTKLHLPATALPAENAIPRDSCYDLYAVITHHGTGVGSGHYTAYCLNESVNQWWHYNDSVVTPVSEETVARAQAYLLFYKSKNENLS